MCGISSALPDSFRHGRVVQTVARTLQKHRHTGAQSRKGRCSMNTKLAVPLLLVLAGLSITHEIEIANSADPLARDPGPRATPPDAGSSLAGLTRTEAAFFTAGKDDFEEEEIVPDAVIRASAASTVAQKSALGIAGRPNLILPFNTISGQTNNNGNDGTIARFGWKAQNKSLLLFSGEAYNVEMGITNELFQTEREENRNCQFATHPNSITDTTASNGSAVISPIARFAFFMRLLAPPKPSADQPGGAVSIGRGRGNFAEVGCALCHTPSLRTGNSNIAAMRDQPVNLFSDLLLHDMGTTLADGISQGQAGPREFRSAPLWGLGQRLFFLHDGRTSDLIVAIRQHASDGSEANRVVGNFMRLPERDKQDLLNFLRSL